MKFLPKRVLSIFLCLVFCLFSFLQIRGQSYAAGELQNYDIPSIEQLSDQKSQLSNTLDPPITDLGINSRQLYLLLYNTADMLVCVSCIEVAKDELLNPGGSENNQQNYNMLQERQNKTALGFLVKTIGYTYAYPPASFSYYAENFLANAGLIKPAYAQGIGYNALLPVLPLWSAARNVAYGILVIVMVAIGFMIIFRAKIDPKTVISVQAAIPKIIVTLLLITFSYAIAGFLIDMMYVSLAIIISIVASATGAEVVRLQEEYLTGGLSTLWGNVFAIGFQAVPSLLIGLLGVPSIIAGVGGAAIIAATSVTLLSIGGVLLIFGLPLILLLAVFLGILFTAIRLTLLLLNSYIQLLVGVILGPLLLLQEAIPGRSAFSGWILNLIANLSVFPTTAALFLFAWFLVSKSYLSANNVAGRYVPDVLNSRWNPPLLGLGALDQDIFPAFLGLGILFLAPTLVVSVKKLFQPKPTIPISAGTMFSPLTGGISTAMGAASQMYYLQQLIPGENSKGFSKFLSSIFGKHR